jgi:hypothetical protein
LFNTIFTPSFVVFLSGLGNARLSGAVGPSGLERRPCQGLLWVLSLAGALGQIVRSMEYHIMVFQTLCKHFALPAISQKCFFIAGGDL